ncbi:nucleotidyltransferase domain-containing protein [Saccharomonospora cyanea]|uniref:Polymerase nucleotidyl transferase domain-containing protein n=1 Tax=Saccharomonospora cyanea NA-134 TaxID=882082 RepID=H5XMP5_9PSEU|nr:nucleotidyltransferase domain-containing protein [Saccharomonospora cyanea]EHR61024.1 hypothetical protein SaccyDRAFT_2134 [Saccharomonospora cyanea NA-134]
MTDDTFLNGVADALAALPAVEGVALGGSRAQGTAGADSDWDLAIYYRGAFDPDHLRAIGWEGEVSAIGGWGGGVFNGGAWLTIEGRRVDVHYRDLDVAEAEIARAQRGEFDVEPLMFHLAGIPTYLIVAELALGRTLRGEVPAVDDYPAALRRSAAARWSQMAELTLGYAAANHAPRGMVTQCVGSIAIAACQFAHAVLAAEGTWTTNDKRLLHAAGLQEIDAVIAAAGDDALAEAVARAGALARARLESATARIAGGTDAA